MIDIPTIDMSFLHFDSITVINILVVILGLWLMFLILQVVLMVKIIKSRAENAFTLFDTLLEIVNKIKGKK